MQRFLATARIDRIYYFDYTKDIGHYDSIINFSSEKMFYIGWALSTPKVRVNASPNSFETYRYFILPKNYVKAYS